MIQFSKPALHADTDHEQPSLPASWTVTTLKQSTAPVAPATNTRLYVSVTKIHVRLVILSLRDLEPWSRHDHEDHAVLDATLKNFDWIILPDISCFRNKVLQQNELEIKRLNGVVSRTQALQCTP